MGDLDRLSRGSLFFRECSGAKDYGLAPEQVGLLEPLPLGAGGGVCRGDSQRAPNGGEIGGGGVAPIACAMPRRTRTASCSRSMGRDGFEAASGIGVAAMGEERPWADVGARLGRHRPKFVQSPPASGLKWSIPDQR